MRRCPKISPIQSTNHAKTSPTKTLPKSFFKSRSSVLEFLSTNLDDYKKSLERITEVIASDSPDTSSSSSSPIPSSDCPPSLFLSSSIDIDAKEMIRALGCLLNYVSTLQSHELLEGDSFQIRIHAFHILQLDNYMYIDRVGIVSFALVAALPSQSGYLLHGVAPFAD